MREFVRQPQDIILSVVDTYGKKMTLEVAWDATVDDMAEAFKTIMVYLQYTVDTIVINPESDDPQGGSDD